MTTTSMNTRAPGGRMILSTAMLLATAAATTAMAAGPDVIVGDLPDVSNYTSSGAINGKRSYSVGTTSCNIGDTPLLWISSTNQHPVISGNLYRIQNGRFEQLGQSWLKHGFTALQGTVCSSCTAYPNGSRLGVGCSDPYASGLNGSQSGLGPKSEVNVSTGSFPYPWVLQGTSATALDKRIVVNDADMGVTGATYLVASMYVAPDDATSGNNTNNQSHRLITVNSATKDITLTGTTQRTQPAIFAWRNADRSVVLNSVDVAGDGRFWVGVRVSPNGSGGYRYFYAVQNLTSHRSGQSFSIPLPSAATATNLAFRDVDYHSGEPFSGTDWTPTVGSGAVTWTTETFAQNQNANALRFDTVYNFSFDSNFPPAPGAATLGLFRAGTSPSVTVSTLVPSPDGTYRPPNDSCANALTVAAGSTSFDTTGATTDGFAEPGGCATAGYTQYGGDIWYRFTNGSCDGPVTISTCGSAFDTKLAVYASCPTASGQALTCNDNATGCAASGSTVSFAGTPGATYLIRIGGHNGATGAGTLTISVPSCGPTNETCAGAMWLADGVSRDGNTTNTTDDGDATCGAAAASPDLWYRYRPVTSGTVTISTCDSVSPTFDTVLSVFTGTCGAMTQVGCNDDSCGLLSSVAVTATAGTTYSIRVAGYNNATGAFKVKAVGGGGSAPPANDDCANRSGIPLGDTPFTTVGASTDGPTHASCSFSGSNQITNDVWFNYPSGCNGRLVVSTCAGTTFNTKIAVYDGYGCANYESRLIGCSDDLCGRQSSVTIDAVAGAYYTIRVGGFNGATGAGVLRLECLPPCIADFNQDGGVDGGDIEAFFFAWENADSAADINQDGGIDGGDVGAFYDRWTAGC
ncbi:MAG: hypothetical protein WCK33_04655 [Phycisphaerae bacterium]